jgi:hypothetical protein
MCIKTTNVQRFSKNWSKASAPDSGLGLSVKTGPVAAAAIDVSAPSDDSVYLGINMKKMSDTGVV